ncbi:uncharacterized protein PAC_17380 [Phialocephala subalpina]|uniref:Heterokaryon incompatibility domain-containing protein n=1 Tax=Phialocephala subalpina TaxID=576137 RepID=A0A1L7XQZ4_9HELO|nr:uncharacterized protein PAC_17380 [Phialocephala subalpina]
MAMPGEHATSRLEDGAEPVKLQGRETEHEAPDAVTISTRKASSRLHCEICEKILATLLLDPNNDPHQRTEIGLYTHVLDESICRIHPWLFQSVFGDQLKEGDTIHSFQMIPSTVAVVFRGFVREKRKWIAASGIILMKSLLLSPRSFLGCSTDPRWIDSDLFRQWKQACEQKCSAPCQSAYQASTPSMSHRPTLLIDTFLSCLIRVDVDLPYVALSYVWGNILFFKTPVVRLLGERFLWVDALCIVQDDEVSKHNDILNMGSIYTLASATIIAAQGTNAHCGLVGLRGSKPRTIPQDTFELEDGYVVTQKRADRSRQLQTQSTWSQRGWTFQEDVFSRRKITFSNETVSWSCACSEFEEDIEEDCQSQRPRLSAAELYSRGYPDLEMFSTYVCSYSDRHLSFQEDALAAFSGFQSALSQTFHGGFLCGLPIMFFDIALCWQPMVTSTRRTLPRKSYLTELGIPSWSWASLQGVIDAESWSSRCDYLLRDGSRSAKDDVLVFLTVNWHVSQGLQSGWVPLSGAKTMDTVRSQNATFESELPVGWSRHACGPSEANYSFQFRPGWDHRYLSKDEVPIPYYYRHESCPNVKFWYPILLGSSKDNRAPPPRGSILKCRTRRAKLSLRGKISHTQIPLLSIRDQQGNWAGALQLPNHSFPAWQRAENEQGSVEEVCELVEISRGITSSDGNPGRNSIWELYHDEGPKEGTIHEFFNVLWAEWENGIAYRKACGRVEKLMWKSQDLEWIDLVLG